MNNHPQPDPAMEAQKGLGVIEAIGGYLVMNLAEYIPDTEVGIAIMAGAAATILDGARRNFLPNLSKR